MTPSKTAPAHTRPVPRKNTRAKKEAPAVTEVTDTPEETPKNKPGRKPNPLTKLTQRFIKAKAAAERADKAFEKVAKVAERRDAAHAELAEAKAALEAELSLSTHEDHDNA